jgi:hypothetical protein
MGLQAAHGLHAQLKRVSVVNMRGRPAALPATGANGCDSSADAPVPSFGATQSMKFSATPERGRQVAEAKWLHDSTLCRYVPAIVAHARIKG